MNPHGDDLYIILTTPHLNDSDGDQSSLVCTVNASASSLCEPFHWFVLGLVTNVHSQPTTPAASSKRPKPSPSPPSIGHAGWGRPAEMRKKSPPAISNVTPAVIDTIGQRWMTVVDNAIVDVLSQRCLVTVTFSYGDDESR